MEKEKTSHKQMLRSTSIIGGSQVFSILIGVIKTKVIALILGPSGIGFIGVLQSILDLVNQVTSFGINFSSVKDIAEADASNDRAKVARTIIVLRRWSLGTGLLGMALTIVFCIPLSKYSFGNGSYSLSIAFISVAVLMGSISSGYLAMLQGLRKINLMAKATLFGSLLGLIITMPIYWWLGQKGVVLGIIITAAIVLIVSWLYGRKIIIENIELSFKDTYKRGLGMARLGSFIILTGFISSATLYVIRAFLIDRMNLDAVGYFQACWMIANLYLGVILNAMLADFFPRLTAINTDNLASNKLINEQMEIGLLVGTPMIIVIIALAPLIIKFLYTAAFGIAIPLLQLQIAGTFFVLISWPLGVMFLAKNKGVFSLVTEVIWSLVFIILIYLCWNYFGFMTLGVSFVLANIIRLLAVCLIARRLGKFSFSSINLKLFFIYGSLIGGILTNLQLCAGIKQYIISVVILTITVYTSYTKLNRIADINKFISHKLGRKSKL